MWDKEKKEDGLKREAELQARHWADLTAKGADVFQYNGSPDMAQAIVGRLMMKPDVVLKIQRELYKNPHAELSSTSAGADLVSQLDKKLQESHKEIQTLNAQIEEAEASQDELRLRQLRRELDRERNRQIKNIRSREALQPKIFEETGDRIEEADKENKEKGQKKTRLQIFARVLGTITTITFSIILPLAGV